MENYHHSWWVQIGTFLFQLLSTSNSIEHKNSNICILYVSRSGKSCSFMARTTKIRVMELFSGPWTLKNSISSTCSISSSLLLLYDYETIQTCKLNVIFIILFYIYFLVYGFNLKLYAFIEHFILQHFICRI
jgi:hypothetical protein